jgi:hypothetical protein
MQILSHRFAGITFQTELDLHIEYLRYKRFQKFEVRNINPDVTIRYRGISFDGDVTKDLKRNKQTLPDYVDKASWYLESPALNSQILWDILEQRREHSHAVTIELHAQAATVFDFVARDLFILYNKFSDQKELLARSQVSAVSYATFLPLFSATMLHSAGVTLGNKVAIFLAPDEGGKTTVAKQSPLTSTVLCDDQVVLRKEENAFMAYGSPWGMISDAHQAKPLGGFFLIEHAENFELIPVKPRLIFDYLWREHEHYRYFLPKHLRLQAFNLLYEVCHVVPCYQMRFPKDYVNWDIIDKAIN